jgi:hypothetical protein
MSHAAEVPVYYLIYMKKSYSPSSPTVPKTWWRRFIARRYDKYYRGIAGQGELFSLIAGTVLLILYVEYEVYEYTVWRRRGGCQVTLIAIYILATEYFNLICDEYVPTRRVVSE